GTIFTTSINSIDYKFVTIQDYTASSTSGTFTFTGVQLYEGVRVSYRYNVDTSNLEQKFVIPSNKVDNSTLKVRVQASSSDTTSTTYSLNTDYTTLSTSSTVYFIQEIEEGRFEVYFGDGITGKKLLDGNIVIFDYVVTNGSEADGASTFTPATTVGGYSNVTVLATGSATGGGDAETVDSIKFNAPLKYAAQGRAVTPEDYKSILPSLYSNIKSVQVWGGEDNDPPVYGRAYISIKPTTGTSLSTATKESIVSSLKKYNIASITPVMVDPETMQIVLGVTVHYNSTLTEKSQSDIKTLVETTIASYDTNSLQKFDSVFRHSNLLRNIDNTDISILSSVVTVKLKTIITPTLAADTKYTINFNSAGYHPTTGWAQTIVESTGFYLSGRTDVQYIDDDGSGNIRTFYLLGGTTKTYTNSTAGTINYNTGEVILTNFNITSTANTDSTIDVTLMPNSNDVSPTRNQILEIDTADSTVTVNVDNFATGGAVAGVGYTTTPSTPNVGSVYTSGILKMLE
ncbi:MAG: hypothetical protein QGH83_14345, partial [Candidatus Pacebacteria bacterium]|nr:hypothetical protein [Candidatus Paceibacterota bacterium]